MNPSENDYHISFFKPTTESARHNRNMVVQLVLIWAVAIFGFQILLKILEKPVPEPSYIQFESSWQAIEAGTASVPDYQVAGKAVLSVMGKIAIQPDDKLLLENALSWMAYQISDQKERSEIKPFRSLKTIAASITDIADETYVAKKNDLIPLLAELFALNELDVRSKIAPLRLNPN